MELVSIASAQLLPGNTLSSFTNFSLEQLNPEGQWVVEISEILGSEIFGPSGYQNVTEGKLFGQEIFKVVRILLSGTWSLPFRYG